MSSIVKAAHGLVAGQRVSFSDIVGGVGIDPDINYFVVPVVNVNDFQIAETEGGTPITFTTVTSANMIVVPETTDTDTYTSTYVDITNPADVMAPPQPLATPSAPVVASDTVTGTVRLLIGLPVWPSVPIRHIEVAYTSEYTVPASAPASPIWTNANVVTIPYETTSLSIRAHSATWYSARVRFVDVYGNVSAWSSVDDEQSAAGVDSINALSAAEASLLDHLIGTVEIEGGAITADLLASTIILGSLIVAGDPDAQHVELDELGIRLIDASDATIVNIPTDPLQSVYVKGDILAGSLTTTLSAEFRTAVTLASAAVMTVKGFVSPPTAAPVLVQGWETPKTISGMTYQTQWNLEYTASGGSGDSTKVFYTGAQNGSQGYVYEFFTSTGALNRTITLPLNATFLGCAFLGGFLYVMVTLIGATKVYQYDVTDLSLDATYTPTCPIASGTNGAIASDGTNLYIAQTGAPAKFSKYNSGLGVVSGPTSLGVTLDPFDLKAGNFDFGAFRLIAISGSTARSFNSSGTEQTSEAFPVPSGIGIAYGDVDGTGACFWTIHTLGFSGTFNATIAKHTNYTWTSGSDTHWVGYSWYDPDGTTHETAMGPRASITLGKRKRLSVTNVAIPGAGGADDPDNARVYALRNATDTGAGTFWLQSTDALTQRYLTTIAGSGTHDGAGTAFPAASPGEIKSDGGDWSLKGDGTVTLSTAVKPGGKPPVVNVYTSGSGSWSKPAGISWIVVEVCGGGGAGGGAAATGAGEAATGAGGGAGAYARKLFTAADLAGASSFSYAVGAGGTGVSAGSGNAGGTSTFSGTGITTVQGTGGSGGAFGTNTTGNTVANPGTGGTASGGDVNADGGDGTGAVTLGGIRSDTGTGGSSFWGGGGRGGNNAVGGAGAAKGSGGGGSSNTVSVGAKAGGAGAAGLVVVTEYYGS